MNDNFGLLYATPTFLDGVARALDLGDNLTEYNAAQTPEQADFLALRHDWRTVGDDLRAAMTQFVKEHDETINDE